ncbi:hypothetical protein EDB85DRAFT_2284240, partial [Lactarius pseudohatsudake]
MDSRGARGRDQLGWGLIMGLAYLHEHRIAHRDFKPGNIVCDVAIEVQDKNAEVDEYHGIRDWTAPEMGEEDGPTPAYSPIKANGWSCGRVLLRHIMVRTGDNYLSRFAEQLTHRSEGKCPSLMIDQAVEGAILCKFRGSEQTCVCANCIYVLSVYYIIT